VSFDPSTQTAEARSFFREWGFVVFHRVLSDEECQETVDEIWDSLESEHSGVLRGNAESHRLLPVERYGLPEAQAVFTPQIVRNRQSPRLVAALDAVTTPWVGSAPGADPIEAVLRAHRDGRDGSGVDDSGVDGSGGGGGGGGCEAGGERLGRDGLDPNTLVVSQDRWCFYPATGGDPERRTKNPGAHLDLCPWSYLPRPDRRMPCPDTDAGGFRYRNGLFDFRAEINCVRGEAGGPHHQGVLNLMDNCEEDGGTALVPGFHRCYSEWSLALGAWERNRVGQRRRGNAFVFCDPRDPIHGLMRRVTLRAGSLLLWDQRTVHGAMPNNSGVPRMAQFVRGFRAGEMTPPRASARAEAVTRELRKAGTFSALTKLGENVAGLTYGLSASRSMARDDREIRVDEEDGEKGTSDSSEEVETGSRQFE